MTSRANVSATRHSSLSTSSKLGQMVKLLQRTKGATLEDLIEATGWQAHSVRGAISGSLRKRHGLAIIAAIDDKRGRVYRLPKASTVGGKQ